MDDGTNKLPKCLVPVFKEFHYVRDHTPALSVEEQQKHIAEYEKNKKEASEAKEPNKKNSTVRENGTETRESIIANLSSKSQEDTAVVPAELHGFKVACRIDTGSDVPAAVPSSVVEFLDNQGVFLSTRVTMVKKKLLAADGPTTLYKGEAQICPQMQTASGLLRLRNSNAKIVSSADSVIPPGLDSPGEILLGNPLLKAAGLCVKDFFARELGRFCNYFMYRSFQQCW